MSAPSRNQSLAPSNADSRAPIMAPISGNESTVPMPTLPPPPYGTLRPMKNQSLAPSNGIFQPPSISPASGNQTAHPTTTLPPQPYGTLRPMKNQSLAPSNTISQPPSKSPPAVTFVPTHGTAPHGILLPVNFTYPPLQPVNQTFEPHNITFFSRVPTPAPVNASVVSLRPTAPLVNGISPAPTILQNNNVTQIKDEVQPQGLTVPNGAALLPSPSPSVTNGPMIAASWFHVPLIAFSITFELAQNKNVSTEDLRQAEQVSFEYVQRYFERIFNNNSAVYLTNFTVRSLGMSIQPPAISTRADAYFAKYSSPVPSQETMNILAERAFALPAVHNLLRELRALSSDNPLSKAASVQYAVGVSKFVTANNSTSEAGTPSSGSSPAQLPSLDLIKVPLTPFSIAFVFSGNETTADFVQVEKVVAEYMQDYFSMTFNRSESNHFAKCTVKTLAAQEKPAIISFQVDVFFTNQTDPILTQSQLDSVAQKAYTLPANQKLVGLLRALPSANPFSTTLLVAYSTGITEDTAHNPSSNDSVATARPTAAVPNNSSHPLRSSMSPHAATLAIGVACAFIAILIFASGVAYLRNPCQRMKKIQTANDAMPFHTNLMAFRDKKPEINLMVFREPDVEHGALYPSSMSLETSREVMSREEYYSDQDGLGRI